jgi:signal transduction histidine kinase
VRFLTILDHNGNTAISGGTFTPKNWRRPFAAQEIGRLLPRWEVAVYLMSPETLSSRARLTALSLAILAGILFITIAIAGFVLFRTILIEIRLARQKTTFVTNVSHELKTPLTSLRIFAELLKERRQPDPQKQEKYLGIMISEIERLTRLINNVLDFAHINRGRRTYSKRVCDITDLCKELAENQRVRLEHNHFTFKTDFPSVTMSVSVDIEAIKQALLNVLANAEKYSADDKWIRFSLTKEGADAVIRIADHGIGIDPSLKESVFKEFYRVDDSLTAKVQGTGLGLSITRQILRDHGGDIRYQKNQPSGSEFVITLPIQTEENSETENTRC